MFKRMLSYFIFTIALVVSFISCDSATEKESNIQNENEGVFDMYYFELTDKEIATFVSKQKSVFLNDPIDKVKEILGEPTSDNKLIDKKGNFVVRVLRYDIKKWEKELVNEKHDKKVSFYFDDKNFLKEVSSNVDGIENRGSLGAKSFRDPK